MSFLNRLKQYETVATAQGKIHLVSISSHIEEDDYNEGLGEDTGCGLSEKVGKTFDSMEKMVKFLADHYGLSKNLRDYEEDEENGSLVTSKWVADHSNAQNGGWMEPTSKEISLWKQGKMKLYTETFHIEFHQIAEKTK